MAIRIFPSGRGSWRRVLPDSVSGVTSALERNMGAFFDGATLAQADTVNKAVVTAVTFNIRISMAFDRRIDFKNGLIARRPIDSCNSQLITTQIIDGYGEIACFKSARVDFPV